MILNTYRPEQVTCLLSPYQGELLTVEAKEKMLREGAYYGDMLSIESMPEPDYLAVFDRQMALLAANLAPSILTLAQRVLHDRPTGPIALVSLARAGTPVGVVLTEVLRQHGREVHHYSASVIHKYGFDTAALAHLLARHAPQDLLFLDGWVSQGRITRALEESLCTVPGIDTTLYCLSDPSGIQNAAATRKDLLLPSAVLNAAVSGLLSRTVYNPHGFHLATTYTDQASVDRTQAFIEGMLAAVAACPGPDPTPLLPGVEQRVLAQGQIATQCTTHRTTPDRIKAGLGEVSRSLLRRMPSFVAVDRAAVSEAEHLFFLAEKNGVKIEVTDLSGPYRAFSVLD